MVSTSRLIVGLVLLVGGLVLSIFSILNFMWGLIYAFPAIVFGIVILLNEHEDEIEERQDLKEKKYTK